MSPDDLDHIWKALADPTRRTILDFLRAGPRPTTAIVEQFPDLSRFAVMKHLDVLRQAALVITREEGRQRINAAQRRADPRDLRAVGQPLRGPLGRHAVARERLSGTGGIIAVICPAGEDAAARAEAKAANAKLTRIAGTEIAVD